MLQFILPFMLRNATSHITKRQNLTVTQSLLASAVLKTGFQMCFSGRATRRMP
jgi:hypothetical protein